MKSWLHDQLNFVKGSSGRGPAWQARWESTADSIADNLTGPTLRVGGRLGLLLGVGLSSMWLMNHSQEIGGNLGSALGGAIIGGSVLGLMGGALGKSLLSKLPESELKGAAGLITKLNYRFFRPATMALGGAAIGAAATTFGLPGVGGLLGLSAAVGLSKMIGLSPGTLISGVSRGLGGSMGIAGAGIRAAGTVAGAGLNLARGVERVARGIFTGGISGADNPLDSWLPFFRSTPISTATHDATDHLMKKRLMARGMSEAEAIEEATVKAGSKIIDPRKFAPNPKIVRRFVGLSALFAVGAGVHEAMSPQIAPPTLFFDGRHMRHINDLGTGGGYGMGMLGRNSALNMNYQDASRILSQMF